MEYTRRPNTNALKTTTTDAKLKYFNAREYFKEKKTEKMFTIPLRGIEKNFKFHSICQIIQTKIDS